MPYNGTGLSSSDSTHGSRMRPTASKISSSRMDAEFDGIADALSNAMTRDGQGPASGNLNLGGFKIINMAPGVAPNDAATVRPDCCSFFPREVGCVSGGWRSPNKHRLRRQQVMFGNNVYDALGEFSAANSRFTASTTGPHYVNASVIMEVQQRCRGWPQLPEDLQEWCAGLRSELLYGRGQRFCRCAPIGAVVAMNPGDFIEIWSFVCGGGQHERATAEMQPKAGTPNSGLEGRIIALHRIANTAVRAAAHQPRHCKEHGLSQTTASRLANTRGVKEVAGAMHERNAKVNRLHSRH